MEEWRAVVGYEGLYQVSNLGRVMSLERYDRAKKFWPRRIRVLSHDSDGYLVVCLYKDGAKKTCKVHRLVAQAFIDNPNNYPEVNHIDENKKNNCVENLEWATAKENTNYGTARARKSAKQKNNVHPCPVIQKTLDGMEVARYASCSDIPRLTKFKRTGVVECLRGRIQTAYGYKWEYATKPWKERT